MFDKGHKKENILSSFPGLDSRTEHSNAPRLMKVVKIRTVPTTRAL